MQAQSWVPLVHVKDPIAGKPQLLNVPSSLRLIMIALHASPAARFHTAFTTKFLVYIYQELSIISVFPVFFQGFKSDLSQ